MLHARKFETVAGNRRDSDRLSIRFTANVADGEGGQVAVRVINLSRQGFMADCDAGLPVGTITTFTAPNGETFSAELRWAEHGRIGCRFEQELSWEDVLGLGLEELNAGEVPGPEALAAG
ncbi:MAG TPA: PilZ domain-containing protein [Allosphingosinicella sp.]|uniref:PilZ domain-containing protein n=1 Tax=Allosphingosinicella sp. TaxID=2823234 RepID=UPI002ED79729